MKDTKSALTSSQNLLVLAGTACMIGGVAHAQAAPQDQGYKVNENRQTAPVESAPASGATQTAATQRIVRFDYISGNVTWRADGDTGWKKASVNQSLHEGGQVWVADGGRAEIRFNDGTLLRLGNNAVVTLQTVYSDAQGEFTQIKMDSGVATLRLNLERSLYQVDTTTASVKAAGRAEVRIGVSNDTEIAVRRGQATVEGKPGKMTLHAGNYLAVGNASTAYDVSRLPAEDSWDRWNDERDRKIDPHVRLGYPVYAPASSFFFGLSVPLGGGYHHWGRGAYWHRW